MALLPQIVRLGPTSYEQYTRCPRLFLLATLLRVPESDAGRSPDEGLLVHEVLRDVHHDGSCHDAAHVTTVLDARGADSQQMRGYVERHRRRCPTAFERSAHEIDRVRFHRTPVPMFLASARIDALWVHDGLLDVRDYKTGALWYDDMQEDPRARLQAWVMAEGAARRGLRLRLRYEFLQAEIDEDPSPWEPDADDLAAIEEELRAVVTRMWNDSDWRGVAEGDVCRTCRYRSICRDSAAPGEPTWPVLSLPS